MKDPFFKLDNWEPLYPIGDGMAVDSQGNVSMILDDGMILDTDSGDVHFTSLWLSESESGVAADDLSDELDEDPEEDGLIGEYEDDPEDDADEYDSLSDDFYDDPDFSDDDY